MEFEPLSVGIVGIGALLVLLVIGVHIGIALGVVGLVGLALLTSPTTAIGLAVTSIFYFVTEYTFVVLPLFILTGLLAAQGGIAQDAYDSLNKWIGTIRGGASLATVGAIALFGTITGSSMVASVTFTRVSAPTLRKMGYEKKFIYGMIASAGAIAMLIPPSALAVVYGLLAEESVGKLLMAGVGPGVLMAVIFGFGILLMVRINPALAGSTSLEVVSWKQRFLSLPLLWPVGVVAIVMVGGIYAGVFTVVEAGAVGTFVILLIGLVSRRLRWSEIGRGLGESVQIAVMVFLIFAAARIFSRFLVLSGISQWLMNTIIKLGLSPMLFVVAVSVLYLILGCFLDSISMLCITLPLLLPIAKTLGLDPIWFAMVVIVAIHVGLITPPVGLNVYATKGAAESDVSLEDIFSGVLPFFFMMVATLILVIAFPSISTWIPSLMRQ